MTNQSMSWGNAAFRRWICFVPLLACASCAQQPCPDGYLRDNDGNCVEEGGEEAGGPVDLTGIWDITMLSGHYFTEGTEGYSTVGGATYDCPGDRCDSVCNTDYDPQSVNSHRVYLVQEGEDLYGFAHVFPWHFEHDLVHLGSVDDRDVSLDYHGESSGGSYETITATGTVDPGTVITFSAYYSDHRACYLDCYSDDYDFMLFECEGTAKWQKVASYDPNG